jgi:hypothetical protein
MNIAVSTVLSGVLFDGTPLDAVSSNYLLVTPCLLVRKRTVPTEQPPPVDEF